MNKTMMLLLGALLVLGSGAFFADDAWLAEHPVKTQAANDPTFGEYHHVYMFSAGGSDLWHVSSKDSGAVTDLDGKPLPATADATHPGCLNVFVPFEAGKDKGISWTTKDGDPVSISSRSENMRVLACRDAVPEYEAGN